MQRKYVFRVLPFGAAFFLIIMATIGKEEQIKKPLGPHFAGDRFINPWPTAEQRGFTDLVRWQFDRLRGRAPEKPETYAFEMYHNEGRLPEAPAGALQITWVGHATTLIQINGLRVLTDPIWSERASPVSWAGPKRRVPAVPAFDHLPEIDAVVISHNHYDHLDKPTIKALGNAVHYFVPLFLKKWLQGVGIKSENITELDWWQSAEYRGLQFVCTPAQHFSGRFLHDRNKTLWCSWVIKSGQHAVYFAGDTGYFPGFVEIGRKYGPFDVAVMPIGAYRPRWFMRGVHVDPAQALQAFIDLQAEYMLPMHWRTFDLADEPMDEPPRLLLEAADSLHIDHQRIWLMKQGEMKTYERQYAVQ